MRERITDREIADWLRALPEDVVPPMPPLRLPLRPRPMPLPWDLLSAGAVFAALGVIGGFWLWQGGSAVVIASSVRLLLSGSVPVTGVLVGIASGLLGWLVTILLTPRTRMG